MNKKTPNIKTLDPTVVSESFMRRVAILAMSNHTTNQISQELGLSKEAIKDIQESERYKEFIKRTADQEFRFELATVKTRLARMGDKALKVYEKVMTDYLDGRGGARDAVVVAQSVTRALGADKGEQQQQEASITVVLPGGKEVLTIEAEKLPNGEEKEEGQN